MKNFKFISFVLLISLAATPVKAQSLNDLMAGQTKLETTVEAIPEEENIPFDIDKMPEPENNDTTTALSVSRLPDIKLNDNIITKTVMDYSMPAILQPAAEAYRAGKTVEALKDYDELSVDNASAAANAALIYLQEGNYKKALKSIDSAIAINRQEPFYQLVKIWVLSADAQLKKARKEYESLLFLTADFEYISSAKMALATSYFFGGKYKESLEIMQNLYGSDPYVISNAVYIMGRINYATGSYKIAQALFEQALSHDMNNYMAQKYLAMTQYKLKEYVPAWQSYASLFVLDTQDNFIASKLKKLGKYLRAAPEDYLYYTRLSELYTKKPESKKSAPVRVGLFSNYSGELTEVQSFSFLPGTSFSITDEKMGKIITGDSFTPKTVLFDKEHKGIHIQNKWSNSEFSTKRSFIIELDNPGFTTLIKDAKTENIYKSNTGDKELKGAIKVIPHDNGMTLINYTTIDDIMPASLMSIARGVKSQAALEAMAIALRTRLLSEFQKTTQAEFDLPDNSAAMHYGGINMQSDFVKRATDNTEGMALVIENKLAAPEIYRSCSIVTEDGPRNSLEEINYQFSPANLFKYMISNPPKDLISAPQDPTLWSAVKWIYMTPIKDIETRLKQKYKIGSLKSIEPAEMTPYGRILKMRFTGSKSSVTVPFKEANFILTAGTLRSNFFVYIPFKKGKEILFIGTDTGPGMGLCIDGAAGMARNGKTTQEILNYYYPDFKISKEWNVQKQPL